MTVTTVCARVQASSNLLEAQREILHLLWCEGLLQTAKFGLCWVARHKQWNRLISFATKQMVQEDWSIYISPNKKLVKHWRLSKLQMVWGKVPWICSKVCRERHQVVRRGHSLQLCSTLNPVTQNSAHNKKPTPTHLFLSCSLNLSLSTTSLMSTPWKQNKNSFSFIPLLQFSA
jgi:hypothetical protein